MNVASPSGVALSSGSIAIPTNRPVCAYYSSKTNSGKLVVLGSSRMFTDTYLEKEKNDSLREMIFEFFDSAGVSMNEIHHEDVDVS